jgi:hypothetical protein
MNCRSKLIYAVAVLNLHACLPADTRPEPGRVFVTASLVSDLNSKDITFVTGDGWTVRLQNLFISVGNVELGPDRDCNDYSFANYSRILSFREPGRQKVAQVWGLNECTLNFATEKPDAQDGVLGEGVPTSERLLMATATVPVAYTDESNPTSKVKDYRGMAMHVLGTIERGAVSVDFNWGFTDIVTLFDCQRKVNGVLESVLPLKGGQTINVNISIEPRNLFFAVPSGDNVTSGAEGQPSVGSESVLGGSRQSSTGTLTSAEGATSLVQLIVDADQVNGNRNGLVDIEELTRMKVGGFTNNLGEVLRLFSYPSMFIFDDGGQCSLSSSLERGRGRGHE